MGADVLLLLEDAHRRARVSAQDLACHGEPEDPGADDHDVATENRWLGC
jgi:hypothetical protein